MSIGRLQYLVGRTLREQRELAGLTQAALAERAGASQAAIARIERGARAPSVPMLERLFAALDRQLSITVEPIDAHLDAKIAELTVRSIAERIADTGLPDIMDRLGDFPYVFAGATAALVQGAPVPTGATEIMVRWRDADRFTEWLTRTWAKRWHSQWQVFGYLDLDPREPGEHRWDTGYGEIRATMVDELPEAIEVRHADRNFRVVPLTEVEVTDPTTADLLRRYREQREPEPSAR